MNVLAHIYQRIAWLRARRSGPIQPLDPRAAAAEAKALAAARQRRLARQQSAPR